MTEREHTPGPWIATGWDHGWDGAPVVAGGQVIATALYLGGTEQAKINARLMAAAPELLEALLDCLREHGGYTIKGECERRARAAIAKARGDSQ